MKYSFFTVLSFSIFLLNACEPAATFSEPQPVDKSGITSFPNRVQGIFASADQSSSITISERLITRSYYFEPGDTAGLTVKAEYNNETISAETALTGKLTDTLFNIAAGDILKKFKGYYFLNKQFAERGWEVSKLLLKEGQLTISNIQSGQDIQKLKSITETVDDTAATKIVLTKRQFRDFIKQDGFADEETFHRVRKE